MYGFDSWQLIWAKSSIINYNLLLIITFFSLKILQKHIIKLLGVYLIQDQINNIQPVDHCLKSKNEKQINKRATPENN